MTVNLDVLMYLAKLALCIAGVIAVIYLILFFKSLIDTGELFQETIKALNRDMVKLEAPLDTIGQVSNTVNEVQASAKRAAVNTMNLFSTATERLSENIKKKEEVSNTTPLQPNENQSADPTPADFKPIDSELKQTLNPTPDPESSESSTS